MTGIVGFVMVFVAGSVAAWTAHNWCGVPPAEAGALGLLMWPVVERAWWRFGIVLYVGWVLGFGTLLTSVGH